LSILWCSREKIFQEILGGIKSTKKILEIEQRKYRPLQLSSQKGINGFTNGRKSEHYADENLRINGGKQKQNKR